MYSYIYMYRKPNKTCGRPGISWNRFGFPNLGRATLDPNNIEQCTDKSAVKTS